MESHVLTLPTKPAPRRRVRPRPRLAEPRLSVVVVNYRSWDETGRLIQHLRQSAALRRAAAEIVVVDNHSPTHPLVPRLRRLPDVSLRRWRRNRGFASAVNEGCRLSRGDWFLLLNPDVAPDAGFLDAALALGDRLSETAPDVGVVGFRLRDVDGGQQLSTGRFPTFAGTLLGLLRPRQRRKYQDSPESSAAVDWATGCCLLVRRRCWEELGGFDRDFFLYYEDVDFCRRARERGWTVQFDPELSAIHRLPLHARAVTPHLRLVTRHALLTFARKHWSAWQARLLARIVGAEARVRGLLASRRGDERAAAASRTLGRLAGDFAQCDVARAARRLRRAVARQEDALDAGPVDRHSKP